MDTIRPDDGYKLPPARSFLHPRDDHADHMVIDEVSVKPQLPSINNMQSYSSHNQQTASDDYLRHRLSDMSVSSSSSTPSVGEPIGTQHPSIYRPPSPIQEQRSISPLEPSSSYGDGYSSRRGSLAAETHGFHPSDYRRPSITELNSLPLPASANVSRRGSVATDYDYSSRSPSPSPFKQEGAGRRDSLPFSQQYDPFQRRHSIATAEPPTHPHGTSSSRLVHSKYRPFRFPATIPESPTNHRTYSAPSSPPQSGTPSPHAQDPSVCSSTASQATGADEPRYHPRQNGRHSSISSEYHPYQAPQHPHQSSSHHPHHHHPYNRPFMQSRRRSPMEQSPVMTRRASMPVVTMRNEHHTRMPSEPHDYDYPSELDEEKGERKSETPYSRSPELRVSHKLAERKRRKEMKELFDELRDSLPVEKNLKTSKWEILSKAVEYISALKRRDFDRENEISSLRHELSALKRERGENAGRYGPPSF